MYIPRHNQETRLPVLHALMRANPLATLVTLNAAGLIASHIPMVVETEHENGILKAHISRANTQGRDLVPDTEALAIFAGSHHYISTAWYPGTYQHGEEVPTWNYAVVHAYGTLRVVEDKEWLLAHLNTLTDQHEATFPRPWKVADAPDAFIDTMVKGIVGLELPIRRLEGKWKMSQNRSLPDIEGVVAGLTAVDTPQSHATKSLIQEALSKRLPL